MNIVEGRGEDLPGHPPFTGPDFDVAYVFKTKLIYTMYPKMNEMYMQGVMDKIQIE